MKREKVMEKKHITKAIYERRKCMRRKKNMVKGRIKGLVCMAVAAVILLTGVQLPCNNGRYSGTIVAEAATVSSKVPIICYTTGNSKVTTYTTSSLKVKKGWIAVWDRCTIKQLYSNGVVKVSYPTNNGTKTAYVSASVFFGNVNWSAKTGKIGENKTVYAKSTGSTTIGTVYASDVVSVIAKANNRTQILYPVSNSSNYKMGWIVGNYDIGNVVVDLNVPSMKQYDSRWKNTYIGNKTIGAIGCTLTCISMKYSYHTSTTTYPNVMKKKLSFSNNDIYWSSVTKLGYTVTNNYNRSINNSIMKTIYKQLKAGKPVIIGGKKSSGGTHWVVVKGYKGTSSTNFSAANFTINDPNSSSRTTLAQFVKTYPTVLRLVY